MTTDTTSTRTEDFTGIRALRLTDERGDVRVRCSTSADCRHRALLG